MDSCLLALSEAARGQKRNRSGSFGPRIRDPSRVQVHDVESSSGSVIVERKAFRSVIEPVADNPADEPQLIENGEHQNRAIESLDNLAIVESLLPDSMLRRGSSSSDMSTGSSSTESESDLYESTYEIPQHNRESTKKTPDTSATDIIEHTPSKRGINKQSEHGCPTAFESDRTDVSCLICMGKFTDKKPASRIPCINNCNATPVHEKCIYNWKERPRLPKGKCPLCRSELGPISYIPPDVVREEYLRQSVLARKNFVSLPIPKEAGVVRFYVHVVSNSSYELFMQTKCYFPYPQGNLPKTEHMASDLRLLTARKRINTWGCSHLDMSLSPDTEVEATTPTDAARVLKECYVGTVQSSFSGLVHTVIAPHDDQTSKELVCIRYTRNRITKVGPRRIQVSLPRVVLDGSDETRSTVEKCYNLDEDEEELGSPVVPANMSDSKIPLTDEEMMSDSNNAPPKQHWVTVPHVPRTRAESLPDALCGGRARVEANDGLIYAENKEPYWLDAIRAYSLDFQGRVTLPSNKNFQLLVSPNTRDVALQFGQVEETPSEIYTMDVQWPLTPAQAFGICLSACDRKLLCA